MANEASLLQRFFEEIHRRSMWQVLGLYLGACWGTLEVLGELIDRLILPEAVFRAAIVLLVAGLPVMLATAYFEATRRGRTGRTDGKQGDGHDLRRWFTWRNATLGALSGLALWGVIAAAFLASRALGVGFAAPLIAQGVLDERERLILAELENRTPDTLLARAVTEALRVDLTQSSALRLVDVDEVRATLTLMQRDVDTVVDEQLAREIARRNGVKAYLAGAVDRLGTGYTLSARLVSAEDGTDLVAVRESADDARDIIDAVDRISRKLRARIGESLGNLNSTPALPEVTTRSLPALETFAAGSQALRQGDRPRAIRLLGEAVRLDSTFASAYRGLAIAHANAGDLVSADRYAALARQYSERLPLRERYLSAAAYHAARGRRDSAAHYYMLLVEAEPEDDVAVNNLGDVFEWLGRYEDALLAYRRAGELDPNSSALRVNLASAGRALGMHELADSAVAAMEANGEPVASWLPQRMANAIYALDDAGLESVLRTNSAARDGLEGEFLGMNSVLDAKRGHVSSAIARADSSSALLDGRDASTSALMVRLAMLAVAITANEENAALARLERWEVDGLRGSPLLYSWGLALMAEAYVRGGRAADAERLLARADSVAAAADLHQPGAVANARALLALSRGDANVALELVERAITADFGLVRHSSRLTRALANEAVGRHREAAEDFELLTESRGVFWIDFVAFASLLPYAHERAGASWLAAGDTARALPHLTEFTRLWADADPALQPRVRAAASIVESILRARG